MFAAPKCVMFKLGRGVPWPAAGFASCKCCSAVERCVACGAGYTLSLTKLTIFKFIKVFMTILFFLNLRNIHYTDYNYTLRDTSTLRWVIFDVI